MKYYVEINGVSSTTINGLAIKELPSISKPLMRNIKEEIDGRDGDLITELGYSAYDKKMEIGLYGDFDINAIIKYFTGEGTITFSNEPDKYYYFKILDQIDYEKLLKFKTATITFHCQPFKYPTSETPIENTLTSVSGTGNDIEINNSEPSTLNFTYWGNSSQLTTNGNQLIDFLNYTGQQGTTTTFTDDVLIVSSTNGTYRATGWDITSLIINNSGKKLWFAYDTLDISNQYGAIAQINITYNDSTPTKYVVMLSHSLVRSSYTIPDDVSNVDSAKFTIYSNNSGTSQSASVTITKPMLQFGTEELQYEPYSGGLPSPNPSYPQKVHSVSGDNTILVTNKNLTLSNVHGYINSSTDHVVVDNGSESFVFYAVEGENYVYSSKETMDRHTIAQVKTLNIDNTTPRYNFRDIGSSQKFTSQFTGYCIIYVNSTRNNEISKSFQIEKGTTATDFVEHEGGSYTMNFPVENLLDISTNVENYYISGTGQQTSSQNSNYTDLIPVSQTSYNWSGTQTSENANNKRIHGYDNNGSWLEQVLTFTTNKGKYSQSFSINNPNIKYIRLSYFKNDYDVMLELGDKANSYYPYGTTPIELFKIGDYKDGYIESKGNNLFNLEGTFYNQRPQYLTFTPSSGSIYLKNTYGTANSFAWCNIPVEKGKKITISYGSMNEASANENNRLQFLFYDEPITESIQSYASTTISKTDKYVTTTATNDYLVLLFKTGNTGEYTISDIQVTYSEEVLPYEPYTEGWYLRRAIGSVVLNGTGSCDKMGTEATGKYRFWVTAPNDVKTTTNETPLLVMADKFKAVTNGYSYNNTEGILVRTNGAKNFVIYCEDTSTYTPAQFLTWLSNNNVLVYYVLNAPTYELVTDASILSQLEASKTSYEGITKITQVNNDLPFNLDASITILYPLEVNNIGNIYAKPVLEIEGSGNIGVVLNGIQILDIALGGVGKIAIDVPNMEAYNPDDNTLLNRLVTGDYLKLLINEGNNTIAFSGNVTKATLTKYTRWI